MASVVETLKEKQTDVPVVEEAVEVKDSHEPKQEDEEEQETKENEGSDGEDEDEESKSSSKRGRRSRSKKVKSSSKEPVTPIDRPTRERKTVERYTEAMARLSSPKPFSIEKGSGTQLKDIPNVAYKLSKRKADDTLQSLHTVLFSKRAKVNTLKKNVGMFSGFVWADDEKEKQKLKVKEKLDKYNKEKLFEFCDILNLQVYKSSLKKEEVSLKLLEFLQSPHVTTEVLLAEKEEKSKKRKAKARKSRTPSKKQSGEKRKRSSKIKKETDVDEDGENESMDEDESNEEDEKNTPSKTETDEAKDKSEEGGDDDEDEDHNSENDDQKEKYEGGDGDKDEDKLEKDEEKDDKTEEKSIAVNKDEVGSPAKSVKKSKKGGDVSAGAPGSSVKSKSSSSKKSKDEKNSKSPAKKVPAKDQGKGKAKKVKKAEPTNEEIHAVVTSMLKEVDFNTATLSDIIKKLGAHFDQDLMHRKAEVKAIITDVINNMSSEDEEEEKEEKEGGGDEDEGGDKSDS